MPISLNVRCFREMSGLMVRAAACLHAPEKLRISKSQTSVLFKLSASSTGAPVDHWKSNQRNRSFSLHQTVPGIRDVSGVAEPINTNRNMQEEATASTEITCLSPKAVKAVDLCSFHLLFIFFWKIEQVGDNLKQNRFNSQSLSY